MYDTVKKTMDTITPNQISGAASKVKAMGESVMKMGLDFANSMAGGR